MSIGIEFVAASEQSLLRDLARQTFFETFASENEPGNMELYARDAFSAQRIAREYETAGSRFFFARCDGEIAGYLKVNSGAAQTESILENALEIERIYVLRTFQGKRIGKELFQTAQKLAAAGGFDWLWLGVWEQNRRAIEFYKHQGFEPFASHDFWLGNDLQTDVLMRIRVEDWKKAKGGA